MEPIDRTALQWLVMTDPFYLTAAYGPAHVEVVDGFRIVLPRGERVVGAAPGG